MWVFNKQFLLLTATAAALITMSAPQARAQFCTTCPLLDPELAELLLETADELQEETHNNNVDEELDKQRDFLSNEFYEEKVKPALQAFTRQMDAVAMQQTMTIGMFFDAKQQLETQRLYQELQVQAHKDYQPSKDFCTFGTNVRSLASSEKNAEFNSNALNARQMNRHLGNASLASSVSQTIDKTARWQQFRGSYCDKYDNNWISSSSATTGLSEVCKSSVEKERINIDIDYTRLIDQPRTLDIAFYDDGDTPPAQQDVIAMGNNLFGSNVLSRNIPGAALLNETNQNLYFALRSVAAKRNVAEHSFNTIVGMKSNGSATSGDEAIETRQFLAAVMTELGVPDDEVYKIIGDDPSYYAQLEILAKKIYQTPNFFAGLYDKPVNVERKSVALTAIELMVDRAIYESQLRQEMAMSVMLSAKVQTELDEAATKLGGSN